MIKIQILNLIKPKYVENSDLLGENFHTVTEPLQLKIADEYENRFFYVIKEIQFIIFKKEKICSSAARIRNFSKTQKFC